MGREICNMDCFNCKFADCINDSGVKKRKPLTQEQIAKQKEYKKQWAEKKKAQGLCLSCGKRKAVHGVRCAECAAKCLEYSKAYYIKKKLRNNPDGKTITQRRRDNGLCVYCGKPVVTGKKVCKIHYEVKLQEVQLMMKR